MEYCDYIKKAICDTVDDINDEDILKYLYTIVMTSIPCDSADPAEMLQEDF